MIFQLGDVFRKKGPRGLGSTREGGQMARVARDSQRSAVYAWERALGAMKEAPFKTLEECEAFLFPIWRSERGRYGNAKAPAPTLARNLWGCRSATASVYGNELKLPLWARTRWVILHETAHLLVRRSTDAAHGPRFVGCLIGMASRHIEGFDGQAAIDLAAEMGVSVDIRSVGAIPVLREPTLADRILQHLPGRITQIAWRAGCRRAQVRGAALCLIKRGQARYYRGRLVPLAT